MERANIQNLVLRRRYPELERLADEYAQRGRWKEFLYTIGNTRSSGKSRDTVVNLLNLEAVGGTDTDLFTEFAELEGDSLQHIRLDGVKHTMDLLREQIENRHTYFLDVGAMAETPYAILVKEVIEARKKELENLEGNVSRLDVLGTYYGFTILMIDGSRPHDPSNNQQQGYGYRHYYCRGKRTWLDENIAETAVNAVKELTADLVEPVEMDKRYRTLGSSQIFKKRCRKETAAILSDAVRLALYKMPGNRASAARALGRTGDSRALEFLHYRLGLEQNRNVIRSITSALGNIGHPESIDYLKEHTQTHGRRSPSKDVLAAIGAIGGIDSPHAKTALMDLLKNGVNSMKAASISALSKHNDPELVGFFSKYLTHNSRPVVRAAVISLIESGKEGQERVASEISTVLGRLGTDKSSKQALSLALSLPEVGRSSSVQKYIAMRIKKVGKSLERWQGPSNQRYYGYWNRRYRREQQELQWWFDLIARTVREPYTDELLNSIQIVLKRIENKDGLLSTINRSAIAEAIRKRLASKCPYEQTNFV